MNNIDEIARRLARRIITQSDSVLLSATTATAKAEERGLTLDALREAVQRIKRTAPPKAEVWTMNKMPEVDKEGEPLIMCMRATRALDVLSFGFGSPLVVKLPTVNDSELVVMMHPKTLRRFPHECTAYGEPLLGGMPVYSDEYRSRHFARLRKDEEE